MADVQHSSLSDPEIHEPKGASTALNNQVLKSDGSGGTKWGGVNYSELDDAPPLQDIQVLDLEAHSNVDQIPTATDTPLDIKFGTASSSIVSIDSSGLCSVTLSGQRTLLVELSLNIGVKGGDGTSTILYVSKEINGSVDEVPLSMTTDCKDGIQTLSHSFLWTPFNGNTLQYKLVRESTGADQGGLYKVTPTLTGQPTKPSAQIKFYKFGS